MLDAGGLGDLADVAERRLRLSANSFGRAAARPSSCRCSRRSRRSRSLSADRIRAWLAGCPAMRAAFAGAAAATVVGTLANDSGALLLEVGTAYLLAFAGFAWAEKAESGSRRE